MKYVHIALFVCLAWSASAFLPCQGSRMWLAGNTFVLMESSPWASLEKAGSLGRDGLQDSLTLLSDGPGITSESAYYRLCDFGQVTLPEHMLASQSSKQVVGLGWGFRMLLGLLFSGLLKKAACPKTKILTGSNSQHRCVSREGWLAFAPHE